MAFVNPIDKLIDNAKNIIELDIIQAALWQDYEDKILAKRNQIEFEIEVYQKQQAFIEEVQQMVNSLPNECLKQEINQYPNTAYVLQAVMTAWRDALYWLESPKINEGFRTFNIERIKLLAPIVKLLEDYEPK